MKTSIAIVLLFLSINKINGQILKTYSGSYQDKVIDMQAAGEINESGVEFGGASGIATYEYYENSEMERIFQGKFLLKTDGSTGTGTISGSYKDNLKEGNWKYISTCPSEYNQPCIKMAEGNYVKGKLNGIWTFSLTDKKTGKKYSSCKAQFLNNKMIGTFEFSQNEQTKFEFKINFDSTGNLNGNYYIKYVIDNIPFEVKREYKDGQKLSSFPRNIATGEKIKEDVNGLYNEGGSDTNRIIKKALEFWNPISGPYWDGSKNPIFSIAKGSNLSKINSSKDK